MKNKRLYNIWSCMKQRCNNPKHTAAYWYHDKGIRVCDEWKKYEIFVKWAFNNGYTENFTIDRIDASKNYCPENCRWVSLEENRKRALIGIHINKRTKTIKKGKFMVVKTVGNFGTNPWMTVVKTGLTKSQALKLSSQLKLEEPYSDNYFYDRVTDGNKEGDIVDWKSLRRYAKYQ